MKKMAKISVWICLISILVAFGFVNGSTAQEDQPGFYELKKGNISMKFTNYGARIVSLVLPDKYGKLSDIVLGFDTVEDYLKNNRSNFGAIVGRVANRISGAQFTLNGIVYKLNPNEGTNTTIHGGPKGFSKLVWKVRKYDQKSPAPYIIFEYRSFDGEEGFPGDLLVTVEYRLPGNNQLLAIMKAKALNKATPVNLAQHAFWNIGGHDSGDILSEVIQIFASKYTPLNSLRIPTGEIATVKGTPFDFLEPSTIGSKINRLPNGYDMNYVLDDSSNRMKTAAIVHDKKSGRIMEVLTNQVSVHFFTSNNLNITGKGGFLYKSHAALCLETEGFPDAVNHPNFPSQILNPGKTYKNNLLIKFSTL